MSYTSQFSMLAYGGTSYSMRRQFGEWPNIPRELLQDLYGLSRGMVSFGMGLDGTRPYLILRERQNEHNRGGYAYTLLLDPGLSAWRAFGWNAAAMAHSILTRSDLRAALIECPERCTTDELAKMLATLCPVVDDVPGTDSPEGVLPGAWVGAMLDVRPVVVNPADLDLPIPTTPARASALLEALPQCFRGGNGWLLNGSRVHGQYFGTKLVSDSLLPPSGGQPAGAAEGDTILSRWRRLEQECSLAMRRIRSIPAWQWQGEGETTREAVYRTLKTVEHRSFGIPQAAGGYSMARISSAAAPTRTHLPPAPRPSSTTM